jgi:hypothetical protein
MPGSETMMMELAGLEPATSWVRFSEASARFEAKAAD